MWKLNFRKSWGIYRVSLEKLYMNQWNGHLEITSHPQVIENVRQYSPNKYFTENSRWVPMMFGQTVLWNICLVTKHGRTQRANWCGFDWKTICVIISYIMGWRHEERLVAAKNSYNNFTFAWRKSHFFEIVKFYSSYKSCNEWV